MTSQPGDPLAVARQLSASLERMSGELAKVNRYSRNTRRLVWYTLISLVLDVALTVVVAITAVQAHNASGNAERASASNSALCQAGNTSRAQQQQLWDHLFAIAPPPATPAAAKQVAEFKAFLRKDFAPRDCAALGGRTG